MKLFTITKETVESKATKILRDYILSGSVHPGSRITEISLSSEMGLSRATIRSALSCLSSEGLVTLKPYSGWMITQLAAEDIWELYTFRSALERTGARLAAEFIHEKDHQTKLIKAYDDFVNVCNLKNVSAEKVTNNDLKLHEVIIEISKNNLLRQQHEIIKHKIILLIKSSNELISNTRDILAQHTPIVEAILAGDISKAGQLSENHNLTEGEKLYHLLIQKEQVKINDN